MTAKQTSKASKSGKRGRPARFDRSSLCTKALEVFCVHGYDASSTQLLCDAMSLTPPSLYNSFGNKEGLFLEALSHYHNNYIQRLNELFEESCSAADFARAFLSMHKYNHTQKDALGCLIVNSSIACQEKNQAISSALKEKHESTEQRLYEILKDFSNQSDSADSFDARSYARYLNGVAQGAAVIARGQGSSESVAALLDTAYEGIANALD